MHVLSVGGLNEQIKSLLETSFHQVLVEGELSRITFHNSGHIYFTLKDNTSAVSCVMFKGNATKLRFRLEEGMKVIVNGAISLYKPRGSYQINCFSIEPAGQGALALAYEQLKEKLSKQGYFESTTKKILPVFPRKIALITSLTGAALQDMLRVANTRYKNLEIDVYDVLVQGVNAASSIANAIRISDTKQYDILVISRGGGSIEDLWAFNEETLANEIFKASTPIVSAVGHEIDWLISDFVADKRAPTPSAAMEMILPDTNELYQYLDSLRGQYTQILSQKVHSKKQELQHLQNSFLQHSVEKKLQLKEEEIIRLKSSLEQNINFKLQNFEKEVVQIKSSFPYAIDSVIKNAKNNLVNLQTMLASNNPKLKTKKGFAQISQNAKVINIDSLSVDDMFELQNDSISLQAKVIKKERIV